jgi:hypothetical protein
VDEAWASIGYDNGIQGKGLVPVHHLCIEV